MSARKFEAHVLVCEPPASRPTMFAAARRFRGQLLRQAGGFALVRYDDLQQDADSERPLQEWFLVPGAAGHDAAAVSTDDPVHEQPGYLLRPEPPAEVCSHLLMWWQTLGKSCAHMKLRMRCGRSVDLMPKATLVITPLTLLHAQLRQCPALMQRVYQQQVVGRGGTRGVNDRVDLWFDGGWWEVEVVANEAEPGQVVIRDPNRVVRSVPLVDLRASVAWMDGSWGAVPPAGEPIAVQSAVGAPARRQF